METIAKIIKTFKTELKNIYQEQTIRSFIDILLEHFAQLNKMQTFLYPDTEIDDKIVIKLKMALQKLKQEFPIQYIIGKTEFYGIDLKVSSNVLIPRPETEELVDLIIKTHQKNKNLKILDIGTGSGCIPIALKKHIPEAKVYAVDISKNALQIAQENAVINNTNIDFITDDILNPQHKQYDLFDIIVSNPPYVRKKEKIFMQKNVLEYEPEQALFVEDDDALIFYRAIINFAKQHFKSKGSVYFEINEALSEQVKTLLEINNFSDIKIIKDLFGKDRIVKGIYFNLSSS